jgi:toxin ParE1/3/4
MPSHSFDRIWETIQVIGHQSVSRRCREELAPGMLSFPFDRYVIFYRQVPGTIEIVCVLHGARDIGRIFEGNTKDPDAGG